MSQVNLGNERQILLCPNGILLPENLRRERFVNPVEHVLYRVRVTGTHAVHILVARLHVELQPHDSRAVLAAVTLFFH